MGSGTMWLAKWHWLGGACVAVALSVAPATGQIERDASWCTGRGNFTPEQVIRGCTALIQSPKFRRAVDATVLATTYFARGLAYQDKGQHDRAVEDYNQAIKLNPGNAEAYNNRGLAFVAIGRRDSAIKDLDQAVRLQPDAKSYTGRGIAYEEMGELDRAIQDYDKAIRLDPNFSAAVENRAAAIKKKQQAPARQ
jgi:tetratricopeptide (TPR) repeat protein